MTPFRKTLPRLGLALLGLGAAYPALAQPGTYPRNGVYDERPGLYAFTHATIQADYQTRLTDATLVIRDGRVVALGPTASTKVPAGAVVQDLGGKYIYPGLVDIFSSYGVPESKAPGGGLFFPQLGRAGAPGPRAPGPPRGWATVRLAEARRLRLEPGHSPRGERSRAL